MTEKQRKLLEALHTLKEFCQNEWSKAEDGCAACPLKGKDCCRVKIDGRGPFSARLKPLKNEDPWTPFEEG